MTNYRIYGNHRQFGWELLNTVYQEEKVHEFIDCIVQEEYMTVMVIKHISDLNQDIPFLLEHLYLEKPMKRIRK